MSTEPSKLTWDDVEDAATQIFSVWSGGAELAWAKEAWLHLEKAGLTPATTQLELTRSQLRLVMLARIYHRFCALAWDEDPEMSVADMAETLEIDPLALGYLAGASKPELSDATDEYELRAEALLAATKPLRRPIFDCLKAAYGDEFKLYSRMWHTRPKPDEDHEEDDRREFEPTPTHGAALDFVMHGFRS